MTGDNVNSHLQRLQGILKEADLKARIQTERIAPSFYYDPIYTFALMACILRMVGKMDNKSESQSRTVINSALLRFYAFCAIRPYLLSSLQQWKAKSSEPSLLELTDLRLLPHGFLLDSSLSDALLFLISTGNLVRAGGGGVALLTDCRDLLMNRLYDVVIANDFLKSERNLISDLKALKISLTDLGIG